MLKKGGRERCIDTWRSPVLPVVLDFNDGARTAPDYQI